jgi:hypothetical protein
MCQTPNGIKTTKPRSHCIPARLSELSEMLQTANPPTIMATPTIVSAKAAHS